MGDLSYSVLVLITVTQEESDYPTRITNIEWHVYIQLHAIILAPASKDNKHMHNDYHERFPPEEPIDMTIWTCTDATKII